MSRPVVCPHCGDELDIPSELRGRDVRCASCRNIFTTATDAPPPPRANRATARPSQRPLDDERAPWDESPRRKSKRSLTWLWVLLVGGGGLTCLGCCGCGIFAIQLDNPDFTTHDSPKGRFSADFPSPPLEAQRLGPDGLPRECTEATRELFLGTEETYFVHYRDLPAAPVDDEVRQEILQDACLKALARMPATQEESRTKLTVSGYPALDVYMTHDDGSATHERFVLAGKRLYAVGITGQMLPPNSQRLQHFLNAFRITLPTGDERPK